MQISQRSSLILNWGMVILLGVILSCSKKDVVQDQPLISPTPQIDEGAAATPTDTPEGTSIGTEGAGVPGTADAGLKTAYFDFDSYSLRSDARSALKSNADWMRSNPKTTVQIEGHCDERGTTEYNLALGERRAYAAREYLIRVGIEDSRLSVISYGEERPSDPGHDEAAWAQNRRAVTITTTQ